MPQEYKDASYSLNTGIEGQITPPIYASPGVLTSTTAVAGTYIATSGTAQAHYAGESDTLTIVDGPKQRDGRTGACGSRPGLQFARRHFEQGAV